MEVLPYTNSTVTNIRFMQTPGPSGFQAMALNAIFRPCYRRPSFAEECPGLLPGRVVLNY
jgi:hypothetical protein